MAIPRRRPTNGGAGTTIPKPKGRSTRDGSRCRMQEKLRSETRRRPEAHERGLDRRREPWRWRCSRRGGLARPRGRAGLRNDGAHDRLPWRRHGAALLSIGTGLAHERNGPDVPAHERCPLGALAEADCKVAELKEIALLSCQHERESTLLNGRPAFVRDSRSARCAAVANDKSEVHTRSSQGS